MIKNIQIKPIGYFPNAEDSLYSLIFRCFNWSYEPIYMDDYHFYFVENDITVPISRYISQVDPIFDKHSEKERPIKNNTSLILIHDWNGQTDYIRIIPSLCFTNNTFNVNRDNLHYLTKKEIKEFNLKKEDSYGHRIRRIFKLAD